MGDLIIFNSLPHVLLDILAYVKNVYHNISANIQYSVAKIVSYFNNFRFIAVLTEQERDAL